MLQLSEITGNLPVDLVNNLTADMLDQAACLEWLLHVLHNGRAVCAGCGNDIISDRQRAAFMGLKRVCCKDCGRWFDAKTGTILSATTLEPRQVLLLALLLGIGRPVAEISARIGIHESTVRDWRDRLTTGCKVYDLPLTA